MPRLQTQMVDKIITICERETKMNKVITGQSAGLVKAMGKAGILPDNCQRVIIDVAYDNVVKVYYEVLGDTRLLDINFASHIGTMITETVECSLCKGIGKFIISDGAVDNIKTVCFYCKGTGRLPKPPEPPENI